MPKVQRPDMADYGVPTDLEGVLPWTWAQQRLVENRNYWVVTASASGRPHAMPVWGVWLPDTDQFWFSCAPTARKVRNLAENPQCVIGIDDTVECVSVEGRARLTDAMLDDEERGRAIAAYLAKYWNDPADHTNMEAFLRQNAVFVVSPDRAFGIIEREDEFAQRATRWRW